MILADIIRDMCESEGLNTELGDQLETLVKAADKFELLLNVNVPSDSIKARVVVVQKQEKRLVRIVQLFSRQRPDIKQGTQEEYWKMHRNPWLE